MSRILQIYTTEEIAGVRSSPGMDSNRRAHRKKTTEIEIEDMIR